MRKAILMLAAGVLLAGTAFAGIDGTSHDLGAAGYGTDQICVFCHTPHGGSPAVPLWNRAIPSGTYTVYTSSTMNAAPGNTLTGTISGMCMSCHDGSIAFGSLTNAPNGSTMDTTTKMSTTLVAYLGTDLSNDHPVNVTYIEGTAAEMNLKSTLTGAVKLDGTDKVQCSSCHDPHNNTNVPFLVESNTGSQMCLRCHTK